MKAKVVIVAIADDPLSKDLDELKRRIKVFGLDTDERTRVVDVVAEEVSWRPANSKKPN